jgi:hypothetical protein
MHYLNIKKVNKILNFFKKEIKIDSWSEYHSKHFFYKDKRMFFYYFGFYYYIKPNLNNN